MLYYDSLKEISEILAEIEEKLESHATTRHQSPMENMYSQVRNRRPPTIYFFKKCIPGHSYCNPPAYYFFQSRGDCPNQTHHCPLKVIHGQTFCPLFVILKKMFARLRASSKSLAQLCKKRMEEITTRHNRRYTNFPVAPSPAYLHSDSFQLPHLLQPPFYYGLESNSIAFFIR